MPSEQEATLQSVWKPELYRMQLEAPTPKSVPCTEFIPDQCETLFEGYEYHGLITHIQAVQLLDTEPEGAYLVRRSSSANGQFYTLSLKFNNKIHHYKLYYENGKGFYVREKRYETVRQLVADGLVTMYLELKVPTLLQRLDTAVNYQESPYMTLNKRKLKILSKHSTKAANKTTITTSPTKRGDGQNNRPPIISVPTPAPTIGGFPYGSGGEITPTEPLALFEKPHAFRVNTFKGLNWCELCGNFLWGFTQQGVKCEDCGFIAHVKCSNSVPADCVPDLKKLRGVFGIDLTNVLASRKATLPFVIVKCVAEIEARGLTCEGIYRLSGFADEIEALKMALDTDGEHADLSESSYSNINVVAGALKLYLRLLPVPLITFSAHPSMIQATRRKQLPDQLNGIRDSLTLLPTAHYHTLQYLLEHLQRVSQHQAINKMSAHNLATVFAPTLIGPPHMAATGDNMAASQYNNGPPDISSDIFLIELLITHCMKIFQ
ncbi:N-chimaerin [Chrysoperla carnea]|uniref:N-chimaerin n=1 Tax=Chrysoperla carnea TaxID=189513 RepID=UPI001D06863C|nr:N-chimaerin [Chrysoperla carnea]